MTRTLDDQMEEASQALAEMDYLRCEVLCEAALAQARQAQDWAYYARIVLPLQECRRQRRMIAAEGTVLLGTPEQGEGPAIWIEHLRAGCIVITHPHTPREAGRLLEEIRLRQLHVEVLFTDSRIDDAQWRIRSFRGADVFVDVPAPGAALVGAWIEPPPLADEDAATGQQSKHTAAADWFIDASEKLGDALLAKPTVSDPVQRVAELEAGIEAVPDHELLHQHLADAAKAAARGETVQV